MNNCFIPDWPTPPNIRSVITTRKNGVSVGQYESFNLAAHVGDNFEAVHQNRAKLLQDLNLPSEPKWLKQIHSNIAIPAENITEPQEADAAFTSEANIICAVLTGDCLPILLTNKQGNWVAAIHGGWKGLAAGIIESTLQHAPDAPEQIIAYLGPAIGPDVYEVGNDVRDKFIEIQPEMASAFQAKNVHKWLANLYLLAKQQLNFYGISIKNIYGGNFCTFTDKENFYSARRDGITGRMASLIWIQP